MASLGLNELKGNTDNFLWKILLKLSILIQENYFNLITIDVNIGYSDCHIDYSDCYISVISLVNPL